MFCKISIVLVALVSAAPAFAGEPRPLTVEQVMGVAQGLAALDCAKDTVKDGANEKEVCRPYHFGGGLVLLIARNLSKARSAVQTYQDAHNRLMRTMGDPSTGKVPDARMVEFVQEGRKILSAPAAVELDRIQWSELKVGNGAGENPIPPSVVSMLEPILEQ